MSQTFQSKYGHHNCDYATWGKLKFLHKLYWEAVRMKAQWERWNRKAPKNRVMRKKIRDEKRQVIGYEAPVPMPEPNIETPFLRKYEVRRMGEVSQALELLYAEVREAFLSTGPQPTPEAVKPLPMKLDRIEALYLSAQKQAA